MTIRYNKDTQDPAETISQLIAIAAEVVRRFHLGNTLRYELRSVYAPSLLSLPVEQESPVFTFINSQENIV